MLYNIVMVVDQPSGSHQFCFTDIRYINS